MDKIFVVFVRERNKKLFAVADTIRVREDLMSIVIAHGYRSCYVQGSRELAQEVASDLNKFYKNHGLYDYEGEVL